GRAPAAARRRVGRPDPDYGPPRAARASRRARPELSLHPGAAGHRQDVDGRADRRGWGGSAGTADTWVAPSAGRFDDGAGSNLRAHTVRRPRAYGGGVSVGQDVRSA